jgi:hypothetical protein
VVVITAIVGSAFFATLSKDFPDALKWVGGMLGVLATVLAVLRQHYSFQRQIEGHRAVVVQYRNCGKRYSNAIAAFEDEIMPPEELAKRLAELSEEYSRISNEAELFTTNDNDYQKARDEINEGQEQYTPKELELGD